MAEQGPGTENLEQIIKELGSAAESLAESQTALEEMHEALASTDNGATPEVIEAAEQVTGATAAFSDTLNQGARALATSVETVEKAASEAAVGFPAAGTAMASAGTAFAAVSDTAAQNMATQGEALRDEGLAHVLQQLDAATASSDQAKTLVLAKMKGLREAARELLNGLTESHNTLAQAAHDAGMAAAQQAGGIPAPTQEVADEIGAACHRAAAAFDTRRGALEKIFTQRQGELEAEAARLESGVSTLLSTRTTEAQAGMEVLKTPVEAALESALRPCVEELGCWRTSLESLATAAEGLDTLADELRRARRVMEVASATADAMGPG